MPSVQVGHIVDIVTAKNEEGSNKVIVKIAMGIKWDIRDLLRWAQASQFDATIIDCCSTLRTIKEDLDDLPPMVHGY